MLLLAVLLLSAAADAQAQQPTIEVVTEGLSEEAFEQLFERLNRGELRTGLLHDKAVDVAGVARFDGTPRAEAVTLATWRQVYRELLRSRVGAVANRGRAGSAFSEALPDRGALDTAAEAYLREGIVPLAILSVRYNKIRPEMQAQVLRQMHGRQIDGLPSVAEERAARPGRRPGLRWPSRSSSPYSEHLAFATVPYKAGSDARTVRFTLAPELYLTHGSERAARFDVDFGDGRGFRSVALGEVVSVIYPSGGEKAIRLVAYEGSGPRHAQATFAVADTPVPEPDRVWRDQQARRGFLRERARYSAYAFYGAGHAKLTRPVIFVEGFDSYASDPARRRTWQDMYRLASEEDFAATLRAHGYDLVLFKLHNAADYVQRNAFALMDFLDKINREARYRNPIVVVGPSMGGLIGRYALAFMEQKNRRHNVRLYVSVDAPHQGANIPLGDQFLFEFFDNDSDQATAGKQALLSPAARQMLIYHYRSFPREDPLRTRLRRELEGLGYPQRTERASLASGSGYGRPQRGNARVGYREMRPGDKIVEYRYRSFFVVLDGNVWALPDQDGPKTQIFQGRKDVIGPHYRAQNIYVSGTLPLDNAPGGSWGTQADIASGRFPYGRIYTSFPDHAWIPTTSALDLATSNLFYNVSTDPKALVIQGAGKQSTDVWAAIYYPEENETHVDPNEANTLALLQTIDPAIMAPVASTEPVLAASGAELALLPEAALPEAYALGAAHPNPFNPQTTISFELPEAGSVSFAVYDVTGREVARLVDGRLAAGYHDVRWDATGLPSGVYFYRLTAGPFRQTRRVVLVK